jgi:hypothetical protein
MAEQASRNKVKKREEEANAGDEEAAALLRAALADKDELGAEAVVAAS